MLPTFIEMAFLRDERFGIQDAVHRSFDRVDLLTHTSVVLIHRLAETGAAAVQQFVRTNQDCPWGLDVPECPMCMTNLFVKATTKIDASKQSRCQFRCSGCGSRTRPVSQPAFVKICAERHLETNKYFTLPFPPPSHPWGNVAWKAAGTCTAEETNAPTREVPIV
jgi:hypothetical protein